MRLPLHKVAQAGFGYVPEERGIFASLNVSENLMLPPIVAEGGMSVEEIYTLFPNLARAPHEPGHEAVGRRAADARHRPHAAHGRDGSSCSTSRPRVSPR